MISGSIPSTSSRHDGRRIGSVHLRRKRRDGLADHGRIEQDSYEGRNRGPIPETDGADPCPRPRQTQPTVSSPPPLASPPLHRITVDEYERIIAAGALEDPSRVELIDGYMVDKMGKNAEHRYTTKEVLKALDSRLPAGLDVAEGRAGADPRVTTSRSRTSRSFGVPTPITDTGSPRPPTWRSLVEVSDSTLSQDRGKKLSAYAKGGIPVYWIVNLVDRQVEVYSRPGKRRLQVAQGLPSRPAGPGHDRRPAAPPDRRRRHPALTEPIEQDLSRIGHAGEYHAL